MLTRILASDFKFSPLSVIFAKCFGNVAFTTLKMFSSTPSFLEEFRRGVVMCSVWCLFRVTLAIARGGSREGLLRWPKSKAAAYVRRVGGGGDKEK